MSRKVAQRVRVATRGSDGVLSPREFDKGEVYQIDDQHPWLYLGFDVDRKPEVADDQPGFLEKDKESVLSDELHWFRWCPLSKSHSTVSADRRFGFYEVALTGCWSAIVRCYVWPAKLFDREQLAFMLYSINQELGRPVVWEQSSSSVRAYAAEHSGGIVELRTLLQSTLRELQAVEQLQRTRFAEASQELAEDASPEEGLVALWALRRAGQLVEYRRRLERALEEHQNAIWDFDGNKLRVQAHTAARDAASAELTRVVRTMSRLRTVSEAYAHVRAALEFIPSMQRDYRLRRLLAAFKPPMHEVISERVSRLSTLPPIKAPEIFELWGAVRIVEALRELGWICVSRILRGTSQEWGVSALDGGTWVFSIGDERLIFDFSPRPDVVDLSGIPLRHERDLDAWAWAAGQPVVEHDTLFSLGASTPDYALRLSVGERVALAIGDASLADPAHQKGAKVSKVSEYRRDVAWRVGGSRFVTCGLGGSFILLPGPSSRWTEVAHEAAKQDCYALCPSPGRTDEETRLRLGHLIDGMRRIAK